MLSDVVVGSYLVLMKYS